MRPRGMPRILVYTVSLSEQSRNLHIQPSKYKPIGNTNTRQINILFCKPLILFTVRDNFYEILSP